MLKAVVSHTSELQWDDPSILDHRSENVVVKAVEGRCTASGTRAEFALAAVW
jgi:hypothetical protein